MPQDGLRQVEGAHEVYLPGGLRCFLGLARRGDGGQVNDGIRPGSGNRPVYRLGIAQVGGACRLRVHKIDRLEPVGP